MRWQDPKPQFDEEGDLEEVLERFVSELSSREMRGGDERLRAPKGIANQPRVDLEDVGDYYRLVAELPGVSSSSLRVVADTDTLTLEGSWDAQGANFPNGEAIISETGRGNFRRVVSLPGPTKGELANAVLENGMLTVELPKAEDDIGELPTPG